jgi:hypothetical protein
MLAGTYLGGSALGQTLGGSAPVVSSGPAAGATVEAGVYTLADVTLATNVGGIVRLRRGDTRTLDITDLRTSAGDPAQFQGGDVLKWTLKRSYGQADTDAMISKTSADGGITFSVGGDSGSVLIASDDWVNVTVDRVLTCVADLQLVSAGEETTLWANVVTVLPDVTLT